MRGYERLREELERRGLRPSDLAKIIGMDRKVVRDVLRGSQDARLKDVAIVAEALGFKVDLMFVGSELIVDDHQPETKRPRRPWVKWT